MDQIEEIVVTAERRETSVLETPAAISAFTGADLDAAGIDNIEGLSFVVPNLHFGRSLNGQYTWELGRWGTLIPRIQFYASDDVWYRPYNEPSTDQIDNYTKTDIRLTWVSEEGHFSVEGFVDNLFDEDVPQSVFVGSSFLGFPVQAIYDPPRTTGIRIGMRW